jgi:hypothetical protein
MLRCVDKTITQHSLFHSQQRSGTELIPGCIGNPEPGEDYCRYPDSTPPPTPLPTVGVTPQLVLVGDPPNRILGLCEGDCDTDAGKLMSFVFFFRHIPRIISLQTTQIVAQIWNAFRDQV